MTETIVTGQHEMAGWLHGTNGTAVFCTCGLAFFARFDEPTDSFGVAKDRFEAHQQAVS